MFVTGLGSHHTSFLLWCTLSQPVYLVFTNLCGHRQSGGGGHRRTRCRERALSLGQFSRSGCRPSSTQKDRGCEAPRSRIRLIRRLKRRPTPTRPVTRTISGDMVSWYLLGVPAVSGGEAENDGRNLESPSTVVRTQMPNMAGTKRDVSVMCSGHILNVWISHWICIPKQLAWLATKTQTRPLEHSHLPE